MADSLKVLGQSNPSATTLTDLYTVPASTESIANILACNRSSTNTTIRVSIAVGGAGDSNEQYIVYDLTIRGNDSLEIVTGISLSATDVIRVYATLATVSFTATGIERT